MSLLTQKRCASASAHKASACIGGTVPFSLSLTLSLFRANPHAHTPTYSLTFSPSVSLSPSHSPALFFLSLSLYIT